MDKKRNFPQMLSVKKFMEITRLSDLFRAWASLLTLLGYGLFPHLQKWEIKGIDVLLSWYQASTQLALN